MNEVLQKEGHADCLAAAGMLAFCPGESKWACRLGESKLRWRPADLATGLPMGTSGLERLSRRALSES
eukprot:scaffold18751_cov89-Phaeocystis_antarctica.AAC.1